MSKLCHYDYSLCRSRHRVSILRDQLFKDGGYLFSLSCRTKLSISSCPSVSKCQIGKVSNLYSWLNVMTRFTTENRLTSSKRQCWKFKAPVRGYTNYVVLQLQLEKSGAEQTRDVFFNCLYHLVCIFIMRPQTWPDTNCYCYPAGIAIIRPNVVKHRLNNKFFWAFILCVFILGCITCSVHDRGIFYP